MSGAAEYFWEPQGDRYWLYRSESAVEIGLCRNGGEWTACIPKCKHAWEPHPSIPPELTTDEAKAVALTLWRMG